VERVAKLVAALDTTDENLPDRIGELENAQLMRFRHRETTELLAVLRGLGIRVHVNYIPRASDRGDPYASRRAKLGGTLVAVGPQQDLKELAKLVQSLDVENTGAASGREPEELGSGQDDPFGPGARRSRRRGDNPFN
jgi:hypothetical protein